LDIRRECAHRHSHLRSETPSILLHWSPSRACYLFSWLQQTTRGISLTRHSADHRFLGVIRLSRPATSTGLPPIDGNSRQARARAIIIRSFLPDTETTSPSLATVFPGPSTRTRGRRTFQPRHRSSYLRHPETHSSMAVANPNSFTTTMSSFFRSLNYCFGGSDSSDDDEYEDTRKKVPMVIVRIFPRASHVCSSYLATLPRANVFLPVCPHKLPPRGNQPPPPQPLPQRPSLHPRKSQSRRRAYVAQPPLFGFLPIRSIRREAHTHVRRIHSPETGASYTYAWGGGRKAWKFAGRVREGADACSEDQWGRSGT